MRRICLCILLLLTACQVAPPVEPLPTAAPVLSELPPLPSPTSVAAAQPTATAGAYLPSLPQGYPAPPTNTPLPPTPSPTITLTPQPTNTSQPTATPTAEGTPLPLPVIVIDRPLPDEFVGATIPVAGTVTRTTGGTVLLRVRAPDGQPAGPDPQLATTTADADALRFSGAIQLELPPTPRQAQVFAQWDAGAGAQPAVEASQPINLQGRYPRVDRLIVEEPQPFAQPDGAELVVRGVAPGPPVKMLVRLLDAADQVLESAEAELRWQQPGLACAFAATLPTNAAATQLQVISLGPDDAVIEAVRVRLTARS